MKKIIFFIILIVILFYKISQANQIKNYIIPPQWLYNDNKIMTYNKFLYLVNQENNLKLFCVYLKEVNNLRAEPVSEIESITFYQECMKEEFGILYELYSIFYKLYVFKNEFINEFKIYPDNKKYWRPIEDIPIWMQQEFFSYFEFERAYYGYGKSLEFCDYLSKYVKVRSIRTYDGKGKNMRYDRLSRTECFDMSLFTRYVYYVDIYNIIIQKEDFIDTFDISSDKRTISRIKYYKIRN